MYDRAFSSHVEKKKLLSFLCQTFFIFAQCNVDSVEESEGRMIFRHKNITRMN